MRNWMTDSLALFALVAAAALPLQAQQAEMDRAGQGPTPEMRGMRHAGNPIERLMDRLEESDPKEYQRLEKLRIEDRKAFRKELRNMIRAERRRNFGKGRFPPPEHRQHGRRRNRGDTPRDNERWSETEQKTRALRKQIGKLADEYKKNASEKDKKEIAAEIRQELAKIYDMRESKWRATIQGLERKLSKMKDVMRERQAQREENIDKNLQHIIGNKKESGRLDSN